MIQIENISKVFRTSEVATFWCDMLLTLAILGLLPATRKAVSYTHLPSSAATMATNSTASGPPASPI